MDLLFGYGSLMNATSAKNTLRRPVVMFDAILSGYTRDWSAREDVVVDKRRITAAFLNITEAPSRYVNGVCFPVTKTEIADMDIREKSYRRVDVAEDLAFPARPLRSAEGMSGTLQDADHVWTYVYAGAPGPEAQVLEGYYGKVRDGCQDLGERFYEMFVATTEAVVLPMMSGAYLFADPEQERHV
ncbi:MAG: gamma-glutamylcyclotransferase [Thermaerobacter sp.]|jgi:hypothetical protein|nr:gamma-glutamylcyclotransferase [Thermaerobacter sp.]